jgi:dienelactone hydrolase
MSSLPHPPRPVPAGGPHRPDRAATRPAPVTRGVPDEAAWTQRRARILATWEDLLLGAMPPAPERLDVQVVDGPVRDGVVHRGAVVRWEGGALRVRVLVPESASPAAPVPVLVGQSSHVAWARAAAAAGMAAALASAADGDDDALAVPSPSALARRAWALSRVLDALAHVPGVDASRAVVAGHSRNGKTALLAAAFDTRFAAVAASSSGVLGAVPARRWCDRQGGEGIELLTRHFPDWFAPSLRRFAGREHLLPTDTHELLAAIAPRPVLLLAAPRDQVDSVPALREAVDAARPAFALLGAPGALELVLRDGGHELDAAGVGRLVAWARRAAAGEPPPVPAPVSVRRPLRRWPQRAAGPDPGRPLLRGAALRAAVAEVLEDVPAARAPAVELVGDPGAPPVLWLAPGSPPTGHRLAYESGTPLPELLAAAGFLVACHDPAGTGARQDVEPSLGRLVADARTVLGTLPGPALAVGFGTGALVAAHLAATDDRVRGQVLLAPTSVEPLLAAAPFHTLADLLGAVPSCVVEPVDDDEAPHRLLAFACATAGARHVTLPDWHRLSPALRRLAVDEVRRLSG